VSSINYGWVGAWPGLPKMKNAQNLESPKNAQNQESAKNDQNLE